MARTRGRQRRPRRRAATGNKAARRRWRYREDAFVSASRTDFALSRQRGMASPADKTRTTSSQAKARRLSSDQQRLSGWEGAGEGPEAARHMLVWSREWERVGDGIDERSWTLDFKAPPASGPSAIGGRRINRCSATGEP